MKFLKNFGLGLVYIVLSPIMLAFLLIVALIMIFVGLYHVFLGIIHFFKGEKMFPPLEEDISVYKIKEAMNPLNQVDDSKEKEEETKKSEGQTVYIQQNYYTNTPNPNAYQQIPPNVNPNAYQQNPFVNVNTNQSPLQNENIAPEIEHNNVIDEDKSLTYETKLDNKEENNEH